MKKSELTCDCEIIHRDVVIDAYRHRPSEEELSSLSQLFKIISDPTRTQILWALDRREMCVCDIANVLNMTKSSISHQLAILRDHGIVRYRRSSREIYYRLDDKHIRRLYEIALKHIHHQK